VEEIDRIRDIVREILKTDKRAKEDDRWLIYRVWSHFAKIYIPFEKFKTLPQAETITRIRRAYNERGMFLPENPDVIRKRQRKEREYRRYYGRHT
jgi:hypothetical protein